MKIGIIGTGIVGKTIGAKLAELGHEVTIGTRDPAQTLARAEPDVYGNPPFSVWQKQHPMINLGTFAEAAAHGEIVINATNGTASLEALKAASEANLNRKVLIDLANPLDVSQGMPRRSPCPTLTRWASRFSGLSLRSRSSRPSTR